MGLFKTREPRRFRRVSIYTNERKEKLDKLVRDVKREQGILSPEEEGPYDPTKFKGTFINYTPRAQKHRDGRKLLWPIAIVIILFLIILWRWLLTGNARF